jgi:hypothetical protein
LSFLLMQPLRVRAFGMASRGDASIGLAAREGASRVVEIGDMTV